MSWTTPKIDFALGNLVTVAQMNNIGANLNVLKTNIDDNGVLLVNQQNQVCQARLTLTTNVPVTTADVSNASTLYLTPFDGLGDQVRIYDGSDWVQITLTELSISSAGFSNDLPHDIFLDYNAASPQLVQVVWSSDTVRATALALQDGIYVRAANTDHLYVGTVRTNSTGEFEDTYAQRWVWNMYNRRQRPMRVLEATNSWTGAGGTDVFRQANGSTANQLDFVRGLDEDQVSALVLANINTGGIGRVAIGLDSSTAKASGSLSGPMGTNLTNGTGHMTAAYRDWPGVGRRTLRWLEEYDGAAPTFYGDIANGSSVDHAQSGIHGELLA